MTATGLVVGFDASWAEGQRAGIGRYATELLAALRRVAPEHEYVELGRAQGALGRLAWTQVVLPLLARRGRPDVCHFMHYHAPLAWRGPLVVTLHDLSMLELPGVHPRRRTLAMAPLLRAVSRRATAIITPSHATRDAAVRLLDLDPRRIHVIPEAPAAHFRRVEDPARLSDVCARYGLRPGFLLAIGTLEPRKNLPVLVDAWATLRADGFDGDLVLAGAAGWRAGQLEERLGRADVAGGVHRLGYVPDADLPALLSLAGALAYPSLLEGFGLPVVEALACGTPTVTSARGAMAEVAGDAALLVDPTDRVALAEALRDALIAGPVRDRLCAQGPRRAAAFSWETAARATAAVYGLAAGSART